MDKKTHEYYTKYILNHCIEQPNESCSRCVLKNIRIYLRESDDYWHTWTSVLSMSDWAIETVYSLVKQRSIKLESLIVKLYCEEEKVVFEFRGGDKNGSWKINTDIRRL